MRKTFKIAHTYYLDVIYNGEELECMELYQKLHKGSSEEVRPVALMGTRLEDGNLQPVSSIKHGNVEQMIKDLIKTKTDKEKMVELKSKTIKYIL